jgi:hypothetical protein
MSRKFVLLLLSIMAVSGLHALDFSFRPRGFMFRALQTYQLDLRNKVKIGCVEGKERQLSGDRCRRDKGVGDLQIMAFGITFDEIPGEDRDRFVNLNDLIILEGFLMLLISCRFNAPIRSSIMVTVDIESPDGLSCRSVLRYEHFPADIQ